MSVPSTAFLDELHALTERRRASFVPLTSPFPGADEPSRASVRAAAKAGEGDVLDVAHAIHSHPEEAFREVRSVAAIADLLRGHGVPGGGRDARPVDALRAGLTAAGPDDGEVRTDAGPTIAILAEYDALPGVGHACGHHLIAGAATGAFLALHRAVADGLDAAGPGAAPGHPGGGGELRQGDPGAQRLLRGGRRRDHGPPVRVRRRGPPVPGSSPAPRDVPRGRRARVGEPVHGAQRARRGGAELPGRRDAPPAHPAERPRARRGARGRDAAERRARAGDRRVLRAVGEPGDAQGPVGAARRHRAKVRRWPPARRPSWSGTPRRSRCRCAPTRPLARAVGACTRRRRAGRSCGGVVPEILAASTDFGNVSVRLPASTR